MASAGITDSPMVMSPPRLTWIRTKILFRARETAAERTTASRTAIILSLGVRAMTEKILPGEGVATVPASNRVRVPVPTIPAAIMPRMVTGLDST